MKSWDDEYIISVLKGKGIPEQKACQAAAAAKGSIGNALELAMDETRWKLREEVFNVFFTNTFYSNVPKISNQWKDRKQEGRTVFSTLESYVGMLEEARFSDSNIDISSFPEHWQRFSMKAGKESFIILYESIEQAVRQLMYSVNFQAVLEKVMISFIGEGNKWLK